jgi:hypothetical protein
MIQKHFVFGFALLSEPLLLSHLSGALKCLLISLVTLNDLLVSHSSEILDFGYVRERHLIKILSNSV